MGEAHPEGMYDRIRRRGGRQCLIMGGFDRHGRAFAIKQSIANSRGPVVSRSRAANAASELRELRPAGRLPSPHILKVYVSVLEGVTMAKTDNARAELQS
jgi:hypothetical protein